MNFRIAFLLLVLLSIQSVVVAQTPAEKTGTATISGRITSGDKPLPNTIVSLTIQKTSPIREGVSTKTDEDGNYKFSEVKAGRYEISVRAFAYVMPNNNQFYRTPVIISEGEVIDKQDFQLKPGGVITGKILNAEGRPLIRERVQIRLKSENNQFISYFNSNGYPDMLNTDDRGIYRVFGIPPGKYIVSIGQELKSGSYSFGMGAAQTPLTYYPSVTDEKNAEAVEVSEGTEATNIDITISKPNKLFEAKGRILDTNSGQPLVGVLFSYGPLIKDGDKERTSSWMSNSERTNINGEFTIFGLAPGRYSVLMSPDEGAYYFSEPTLFEIYESNLTNIIVNAHSGASISGVVAIEGTQTPALLARLRNLRVSCHVENNPSPLGSPPGRINADGTFILRGLAPGKARLYLSADLEATALILLRTEKDGVVLPNNFEVSEKNQIKGIRLIVTSAIASIHGQVNIVGGSLLPNEILTASLRSLTHPTVNMGNKSAVVSSNGKFVIDQLLPGEYEIVLYPYIPNQKSRGKQTRQKITVNNSKESAITLTLDLGEEGEKK
jgi:Carboxypeptidase regulatory-like domain